MKNFIVILFLAFALAAILYFASNSLPARTAAATDPKTATETKSEQNTESRWTEDYNYALKKAAKENKLVFADFAGSDWCPVCMMLDEEILSQKSFLDFADKNFVLLMLDFPRKKQLSADLQKQNAELSKKYDVEAFPTVLILDSKGNVIEKTGYLQIGPDAYIKMLQEIIDRVKKPTVKK